MLFELGVQFYTKAAELRSFLVFWVAPFAFLFNEEKSKLMILIFTDIHSASSLISKVQQITKIYWEGKCYFYPINGFPYKRDVLFLSSPIKELNKIFFNYSLKAWNKGTVRFWISPFILFGNEQCDLVDLLKFVLVYKIPFYLSNCC